MSWEATNWVMDKSTNKGADLFTLLLIANDMNSEGRGSFPTRSKLARQLRMPERSVTRILHRLEKSGELVAKFRGSGRERSQWCIPGVIKDGYASGAGGVKLTPQGSQIGIPGGTKRHPTPDKTTPVPPVLTLGVPPVPTNVNPPPPGGGGEAEISRLEAFLADNYELARAGVQTMLEFDTLGVKRLWEACRKAVPKCTVEDVKNAVLYKGARLKGARNPVGLLIRTVPALLLAWSPVSTP